MDVRETGVAYGLSKAGKTKKNVVNDALTEDEELRK